MKTLRAAFIKAGYKSMSTQRTDVPKNKYAQKSHAGAFRKRIKRAYGYLSPDI